MAAKNADPLTNPLSVEMGAQSWTNTCGVCHVGGGQMEYDRDLNDYSAGSGPGDAFVLKYARLDDLSTAGVDETSWDNVQLGWLDSTNKAEMDCLMCHLDGSNAGSAWMKTLDCGPANPIGPMTDPTCSGTPMFPGTRTVTLGDGVTDYDMFNRNFALKQRRNDLMASMGAGAKGVFTGTDLTGVDWGTTAVSPGGDATGVGTCVSGDVIYNVSGCGQYFYAAFPTGACESAPAGDVYFVTAPSVDCVKVDAAKISSTPKSENCSVCHARDDNTMGLPGMMGMKTGFGNYGLIHDPSNPMTSGNMGAASDLDTDNGAGAANDDYWFDFGCKTGMGKRAHKIGATGDYIGPNARYGMSMFLPSTLDMDPATVPNAGDPIPGKMPDIDVHDAAGMQCATCHYALGSDTGTGYVDIPATTSHGFDYPAERIYAMDHQFAQADSLPDTKGKNNLDAILQCGVCHIDRTHPNLTDNGGTLNAPTPLHNGMPALHQDRIGCVTCHVPETYSAPGRLKYRDWTAGFARGTFRNQLDWNFDLVTGTHNTVPTLRKWATKNGETKIYPFLPSLLPTWFEVVPNSGVLVKDDAGLVALGEDLNIHNGQNNILDDVTAAFPSPVKNRDLQKVGEYVRDNNPQFDMRLNGGNTVPLFDGFQIVDSWEIDTEEEIDTMLAAFQSGANGSDARYVKFLNSIQADFDVTHGIVPKEWALGGSERGGCVSCHSSMKQVLSVDMTSPDFMAPNPNYSPFSIGFFEGYTQPIDNKGLPNFGVGGSDVVKNWMALFADFDAAEMCGMGDPSLTATDGMGGMLNPNTDHHNFYFNPLTGQPNSGAACSSMSWFSDNPMFGTTGTNATIDHVIGMMTQTFDAAMGFPAGSAMQMGMFDGVAGIQGFALKELQTAGTLGCNGFAGPISFSPMPGMSVNNCMPNYADAGVAAAVDGMMGAGTAAMYAGLINGTCVGAAPPTPGACSGGFRNAGACFTDADCSGAMTDMAEIGHNGFGLIMDRATAKSHFKIDLQQGFTTPGDASTAKVKWGAGGEQNPSNPNHVNKWDQAQYCYDWMTAPNPMMPNVVPCIDPAAVQMDGKRHIATAQSANQFLGYTDDILAVLMTPGVAQGQNTYQATAQLSALSSTSVNNQVSLNASRSACSKLVDGVLTPWALGCTYSWDTNGATITGGNNVDILTVDLGAPGDYPVSVTVCLADDTNTGADESGVCDTDAVTATARTVEDPVSTASLAATDNGDGTCTIQGAPGDAVRAYVFWGNRTRTTVTNTADFSAGVTHSCGANIRVKVYDANHNITNLML